MAVLLGAGLGAGVTAARSPAGPPMPSPATTTTTTSPASASIGGRTVRVFDNCTDAEKWAAAHRNEGAVC